MCFIYRSCQRRRIQRLRVCRILKTVVLKRFVLLGPARMQRLTSVFVRAMQDAQEKFERELRWCIEQLDISLTQTDAKKKIYSEHMRALQTLKNEKAPVAKKRQVMSMTLGNYREKMKQQEAKFAAEDRRQLKLTILRSYALEVISRIVLLLHGQYVCDNHKRLATPTRALHRPLNHMWFKAVSLTKQAFTSLVYKVFRIVDKAPFM
ncbi:hypothetical protein HPB48_002787 [Haemaphysalis longicornis]|uniref:Uncharacterized protein n=1 Tax=Haemaphysalis longicornis TaxID=44386 RepID=A0A9J6GNP9_HAELO|nr:hypothetical protein HPB48_002787 [Haemaphysalis longicornis]